MDAFLSYIASHWVEWVFALLLAVLGLLYRSLVKKVKEDKEEREAIRTLIKKAEDDIDKNKAIAQGVQALLRDSIIKAYNKYSELGYCPIYAKENIRAMYAAYHLLGGNDIATALYKKLIDLPEVPEEGERDGKD